MIRPSLQARPDVRWRKDAETVDRLAAEQQALLEAAAEQLRPGGTLVYCAVDDVDALYTRARENGADVAMEIEDTDYGSRDFTVRDPEGNLWAFGTYRP